MEEKISIYINKIMREGRRKLNSLTGLYNITGKQSRVLVYIYDESQTCEVNQTDIENTKDNNSINKRFKGESYEKY